MEQVHLDNTSYFGGSPVVDRLVASLESSDDRYAF
jgi:hypothetical protein